jgi:hypothetical protein
VSVLTQVKAATHPSHLLGIKQLSGARGLVVVHGHAESTRLMHYFLLAPLLRGETVLLLDAANCFNPHRLAQLCRRAALAGPNADMQIPHRQAMQGFGMTGRRAWGGEEKANDEGNSGLRRRYQSDSEQGSRYGVEGCLERVRVSRAFTCFQLAELIERVPAAARRYGARRVVLTGVPDIFDDEELSDAEARAVFRRALARLRAWQPPVLTALVFSDRSQAGTQRRLLRAPRRAAVRPQLERELFRQAAGVYRLAETPAGLWLRAEKAPPLHKREEAARHLAGGK